MRSSVTPNRHQQDANVGARREGEEELRKRKVALDAKRQEIISHYEPYLKEPPPEVSIWKYVFVTFVALTIIFHIILFPKVDHFGIFIVSITLALIIGPGIKQSVHKKANRYDGIKATLSARRKADLAAVDGEIRSLEDDLIKKTQLSVTDEFLITKAKSSQNIKPRAPISEKESIPVKETGRPSEPEVGRQGSALAYPILVQPEHIQRRRLAELMSIPWRNRTNEQMDELIEIDIWLGKVKRTRETNL